MHAAVSLGVIATFAGGDDHSNVFEFMPLATENKPSVAHLDHKSNSKIHTTTKDSIPSLKTSDDAKWRVGVHALDPKLGARFDGVKIYCAKEVLENAADGDFRWASKLGNLWVLQYLTLLQF